MGSVVDPVGDGCHFDELRQSRICPASTPAPSAVDAATTNVVQSGLPEQISDPAATTISSDDQNPEGGGARVSTNVLNSIQTHIVTATETDPTASPTSAPTEAAIASSSSNGSSLSTGAVAGIAICALFVGAALAFLAAFFLFKRRNRKQSANVSAAGYTSYADSTPELVMMQQKSVGLGGRNSPYVQVSQTPIHAPAAAPVAAPVAAPAPTQQSNAVDVAGFLPPAAHESAIHSRVSALFSQIHRHVEMYYRDVHASITPSMEPELARFGAKEVNMAALLQDCSSPTTALKHALVAYVLGITGPKKDDDGETLFPEELNGVRIQNGQDAATTDSNLTAATTLHRRLSVYLYISTSSISNPRRSWAFQSDMREAAEHFSLTFFPWANPTASDQEREEDLARIISEALELRIWLFGQPFSYEFEWEGTGRRGVLVSPGLIRRANEQGEGERRMVMEGTVVGL
ncbi:Nn.00g093260.m01.CDS01 [Neocucurbitaria sp. VM-36]